MPSSWDFQNLQDHRSQQWRHLAAVRTVAVIYPSLPCPRLLSSRHGAIRLSLDLIIGEDEGRYGSDGRERIRTCVDLVCNVPNLILGISESGSGFCTVERARIWATIHCRSGPIIRTNQGEPHGGRMWTRVVDVW